MPANAYVHSTPGVAGVARERPEWSAPGQIAAQQAVVRLGVQPDLVDPSVFVAQEQGALADAGLALEVRYLGWGEIMDSLADGGLDAGLISSVAFVSARALGHDLRIVAAGTVEQAAAPTRRLVVPERSTIQRAGDLVDHWVGVPALGSADHLMLQSWLTR
ncbi:MAG TPA: ABC transporter substrate-binding protein [Chloroflexota bacterium]|nr:ABC transporter substrate-binding protein [Chloroflexota bacterium]